MGGGGGGGGAEIRQNDRRLVVGGYLQFRPSAAAALPSPSQGCRTVYAGGGDGLRAGGVRGGLVGGVEGGR